MSLHRLVDVRIGVPNVAQTRAYYQEFGLTSGPDAYLHTADGGPQLLVDSAPTRRVTALTFGVDDADDVARIARQLADLGFSASMEPSGLSAFDPGTGIVARVAVAPRVVSTGSMDSPANRPGNIGRRNRRAASVERSGPVRPRKLGHVVVGSVEQSTSERFFIHGLGLRVSDMIGDEAAFLRCSTDHHNLLISRAPMRFLHHTAWEVEDIDEIGRGATQMLEGHPERHAWGLGRHHIGSNLFWYLRDPAGNFSEYYADLDCIAENVTWTPEVFEGPRTLYNWGPPPPRDWVLPADVAAGMSETHSRA